MQRKKTEEAAKASLRLQGQGSHMRYLRHLALALASGVLLASVALNPAASQTNAGTQNLPSLNPAYGCLGASVPTLDPTSAAFLPGDMTGLPMQSTVNCFAWQTFIALNWPVDPAWPANPERAGEPDRSATAATWGNPQDPRQGPLAYTAWETFKSVQDVFVAPGQRPTGWGASDTQPNVCTNARNVAGAGRPLRVISSISKVPAVSIPALRTMMLAATREAHGTLAASDANLLSPDSIKQAMGGWLTDQQGNVVWYERAMNRQEFEYMMKPGGASKNALYTRAGQLATATNADGNNPDGLSFPTGMAPDLSGAPQPWDALGATEIKAAWRVLTNQPQLWSRYLLSEAWLVDPVTNGCRSEILGLVGLHIIRKTQHFPDFAWATFEHVDNAPDQDPVYADPYTHPYGYSFNNPNCTQHCEPNVARDKITPKPPMNQPVQVTRVLPIPSTVASLNLKMHQEIVNQNAASVFQYYQLVNVQWDKSPVPPITTPGGRTPLSSSSMTSDGNDAAVANTTLETYAQSESCVACHRAAAIRAAVPADESPYAGDYSFTFLDTKPLDKLAHKMRARKIHEDAALAH